MSLRICSLFDFFSHAVLEQMQIISNFGEDGLRFLNNPGLELLLKRSQPGRGHLEALAKQLH